MKRRRVVPPAVETPQIAEAHDLRVKRGKILGEIHAAQWEFDRRPTVRNAERLAELRETVNRLEAMIAEVSEQVIVKDQILRSMLVLEGIVGQDQDSS